MSSIQTAQSATPTLFGGRKGKCEQSIKIVIMQVSQENDLFAPSLEEFVNSWNARVLRPFVSGCVFKGGGGHSNFKVPKMSLGERPEDIQTKGGEQFLSQGIGLWGGSQVRAQLHAKRDHTNRQVLHWEKLRHKSCHLVKVGSLRPQKGHVKYLATQHVWSLSTSQGPKQIEAPPPSFKIMTKALEILCVKSLQIQTRAISTRGMSVFQSVKTKATAEARHFADLSVAGAYFCGVSFFRDCCNSMVWGGGLSENIHLISPPPPSPYERAVVAFFLGSDGLPRETEGGGRGRGLSPYGTNKQSFPFQKCQESQRKS
jgi:hypothetical protein